MRNLANIRCTPYKREHYPLLLLMMVTSLKGERREAISSIKAHITPTKTPVPFQFRSSTEEGIIWISSRLKGDDFSVLSAYKTVSIDKNVT